MSVEVRNESGYDADLAEFAALGRFVIDAMHVHPQTDVSIRLVDTEAMTDLHVRWMDEPGPTDVMSFPMDELDTARRPDEAGPGPALLGDVVLCPAVATEQAVQAGHSLDDELHLLTVHGVLHLLGYDHAEPEQEREMFGLQARLLDEWRAARQRVVAEEARRRSDSAVLGVAGLEDG